MTLKKNFKKVLCILAVVPALSGISSAKALWETHEASKILTDYSYHTPASMIHVEFRSHMETGLTRSFANFLSTGKIDYKLRASANKIFYNIETVGSKTNFYFYDRRSLCEMMNGNSLGRAYCFPGVKINLEKKESIFEDIRILFNYVKFPVTSQIGSEQLLPENFEAAESYYE